MNCRRPGAWPANSIQTWVSGSKRRAFEELPADAIVPPRVVLSHESAERVRDLTSHPPQPTEAMRELFDDR